MEQLCNLYLLLFAVLLSVGTAHAVPGAAPVHEFRLENGLRLLVKESRRSPVVVSQVWYQVGSSYEHHGITGISHILEHMMFKGTEAYPGNTFSQLIASVGGRDNAFTSADYTAYHQQLASNQLELSFRLEADRMQGLLLQGEELQRELKVVMEERRWRVEDEPRAYTHELLRATAFQVSPYRHPIIGWPDDIENTTPAELRDWYQRWYRPSNALVVVAGDVRPEEVLELARKHFGSIPAAAKPPPPLSPSEPRQQGLKRLKLRRQAELPYLVMAYKAPTLLSSRATDPPPAKQAHPLEEEIFALEVLDSILSGGDSARLQERLVRGRAIAAGAGTHYDPYDRLETLFLFTATPTSESSAAELEQAWREEIKDLHQTLVSEEELARVKAQVVAEHVYERDSLFFQALLIGLLESVGLSWEEGELYPQRVQAVSAEQVRAAARKYLVDESLTVAELEPLAIATKDSGDPPAEVSPASGALH